MFLKRLTLFAALLSAIVLQASNHVPGQLLIQLRHGVSPQSFVAELNRINPFGTNGFQFGKTCSRHWNIHVLDFPQTIDETAVLQFVNSKKEIAAVQFNHYVSERIVEPDDPRYLNGEMWDMKNTGQSGGTNDADIDAPEAWEISTGGLTIDGDTIVVAVIDGNFSLSHPDLTFWKNYQEIPGNNIDDDNNGYIDDVNGWNASNSSGTFGTGGTQHGTHVSGTVGAIGNNNLGVTGVNWNMKVMAIRGSSGTESVVVEAYAYAADQRRIYNETGGDSGAFVVSTNASFGVDAGDPADFPIWCGMYDSLGALGILSAGATANQGWDIDVTLDIPTACPSPWMISVTNTTRTDARNSSAGYGLTTIDIGAPGTSVSSTSSGTGYAILTGTSMATPHVSGMVGLMYSAACQALLSDYMMYPDSISLLVRNMIFSGADPIAALAGASVTGGRLNAYNALMEMLNYCSITGFEKNIETASSAALSPNPGGNGPSELRYTIQQTGSLNLIVLDATGRRVKDLPIGLREAGTHNHTVSLDDLPAGFYFLSLQSNGQTLSKSIKYIRN